MGRTVLGVPDPFQAVGRTRYEVGPMLNIYTRTTLLTLFRSTNRTKTHNNDYFVLLFATSFIDIQDLKYALQVAPKSIARFKHLEVAYKSIIDYYVANQEEMKLKNKGE